MSKTSRIVASVLAIMILTVLAGCGDNAKDAISLPADTSTAAAPVGNPEKGSEIFNTTCFVCHGEGGVGVPNLGKDMTVSTFIHESDDAELLAFIKKGRDPSDPANTTGVSMPANGGNPTLSDEDLIDVIAYIRTLNVNAE